MSMKLKQKSIWYKLSFMFKLAYKQKSAFLFHLNILEATESSLSDALSKNDTSSFKDLHTEFETILNTSLKLYNLWNKTYNFILQDYNIWKQSKEYENDPNKKKVEDKLLEHQDISSLNDELLEISLNCKTTLEKLYSLICNDGITIT